MTHPPRRACGGLTATDSYTLTCASQTSSIALTTSRMCSLGARTYSPQATNCAACAKSDCRLPAARVTATHNAGIKMANFHGLRGARQFCAWAPALEARRSEPDISDGLLTIQTLSRRADGCQPLSG